MMLAKRVAALLTAMVIVMLLTGMVALAAVPAKARAAEAGGEMPGMITAAVTPAKPQAADEVIDYELNDSYGDGWNGNSVEIVDTADNTTLATLTFESGNHAEGTISLVRGHVYQFIWRSGSWVSECSFTFRSGSETILKGSGANLANNQVLLTYAAGVGPYESYNLWVANTQVANVNASDVLGDGSVSYDVDTKTLTLGNCACVRNGGENAKPALIYADNTEGSITINLKGNNVLEGAPGDQYGIYAGAGMTVTGDGSLTVVGGGSSSGSTSSFGVYSTSAITLDSSFTGTVVAKGAATAGQSTGFSGANVIINGGTLIAVGGVGQDDKSIGIHADSSLSVTGGTVITQGGVVEQGNSIGIDLGSNATLSVNGGALLVQGGKATGTNGYSWGVYCENGGQVTFSGGASVVRAGVVGNGTALNQLKSAHRSLFGNCNYATTGMTAEVVGYIRLFDAFTTGSNVYRQTGFACVPSSWTNLGSSSSAAAANLGATLSNDSYFINTTKTSLSSALTSLDTNGHTLFVVNLFEGDPDNWAAGLVLSNEGDVSFTGSGSVVAVGGMTSTAKNSHGLRIAGNLTVAGPTVVGVSSQGPNDSSGVRCPSGSLTVSSGKVIGVGSGKTDSSNYAGSTNNTHGMNVNQSVIASGTGNIVGVGGFTPGTNTYGIEAQSVAVQDNASVLGVGGSPYAQGQSYGIDASSVEVSGGSMAGVGGDNADASCGMNGGSVQVHRSGRLNAISGVQATSSSYGISGLTDGCILEGDAVIAGMTKAIGSSDGTLQLDDTGLAFGYTDFAGTAEETTFESGAPLSALSGYKHIKVDTPPIPLTSGTCGTCYWEITPDKVLTVYPGELAPAVDGAMPWIPGESSEWELSDIEHAVMVSRGEAKVVAPSDSSYILSQLSYAQSMDLSGLDTSQAQDLSLLFAGCGVLESLDVSMLDTSKATTTKSMFQDCSQLGRLDLSSIDVTKTTDASRMFSGCTSLASLSLPTAGMASVIDASSMFTGCTSLENLDLSDAGMGNVVDASKVFSGCTSLGSLDLSALDMAKVADAAEMFAGCTSLASLSLPTAGMASVTDASGMFSGCSSLKSLDLSTVDMASVTDASSMFSGCTSLESLKLGSACKLASNVALPEAPTAHPYTGKWVREEGGEPLTAAELMSTYDGSTMAGTYVWEQIVQRTLEELNQLITTATTTAPYKDVDSVSVSTDGTDVYTVDMWVTQEAKDALTGAIAAAQEASANGEATQEQRDVAYYALEAAMANYAPERGTKERQVEEVTTWSRLYELLQENGSNIKLTSDVKFGTGGGEYESAVLVVPTGFVSKLDLNGHIVDRGLGEATEAVEGGSVIDVFGELTITDSQPNAAHSPAVTFVDPLDADKTIAVKGGVITGGFAATQYESDSQRCYGGGGVLVERNAHLAMTGGSICGNRATSGSNDGGGGGVAVKPNGVFDMSGNAAICGNVCYGDGGGIWLENAALNMDGDASIYGNFAGHRGGGVSGQRSEVSMKGDSSITGNIVSDGVNGWGGGIDFFTLCSLTMEDNAAISSNVATGRGGGVCVTSFLVMTQTITMKDNATISNNSSGDFGGGAFIHAGAELNMSGEASIAHNNAGGDGGGVSSYSKATLNMTDEAAISNNTSNGSGGGVNLGGGSKLNITGGTIADNSARYDGGGVFAESNTPAFTIAGTVVIDGNEIVDENGNHVSENNIHGAAGSGSSMAVPITVTGALGEGSAIGITQWGVPGEDLPLDAVSGFAEYNPDLDPASVFTSDSAEYIVIVSADGEPQLALPEGVGIWIGGKQVNVLNASDVFGDGKVSYDQATRTLTLNGYHFDGYGEMTHHAALATTVENLTVNVVGDNKIVESGWFNWDAGTDCFGIWAADGLTITGSGKLESWAYYMNTSGTTGAGIFVASGSLTIGEDFTGELWAHANRGIGVIAAGDVLVDGGKVKFAGETRAVEAASVSLGKDLAVFGSESTGMAYDSENAGMENGVVLATNTGTNTLDITALASETYKSIWTEPLEYYDLWVNGEQFNNVKLTIACGEGTAVFDPAAETPTLTLTNATIANHPADSAMGACIYSELSDLRIEIVGNNLVKPTDSGIDGVRAADDCNVAVVGEELCSLKLEDVNYGFNLGGSGALSVGGNLEVTSTAGGTNVSDSAITLAEGWGCTEGASLTQSGKVVVGRVVTVTFDGNGHGGVLATLQVPKGKSVDDVIEAMSAEVRAEFEAKALCELTDGGKTYQVIDYCTSPACIISVNWPFVPTQDVTIYAKWAECITLVEITVEPPVCGTATETSKDSQGYWDFVAQTNKPVGSVTGPNYVLAGDENGWSAGWIAGPAASAIADPDAIEPYVGEFSGGASYTLAGGVQAHYGYLFSKDAVVKVNGAECVHFTNNWINIQDRNSLMFVGEVRAAHVLTEEPTHAEVPATCGHDGTKAYWECSVCGRLSGDAAGTSTIDAPQVIPATGNHSWDAGTVTREPTATEDGERAFTCAVCGATKTEAIPKLDPSGGGMELGADGTALGPGASTAAAELFLTTKAQGESEPAGTVFHLLRARAKKLGKTSVTLAWTKVNGAKKYVVYGEKCGKGTKRVRIAETAKLSMAFSKVAGKKVVPKTFYKFNVVALDRNDRVVCTSKTIHVVTKGGGKYCNEKKVTVKKAVKAKAKRLKVGKSLKLKAKAVRAKKDVRKKLKLARHRAIAYESSNPTVATVTAKGVVMAKKKGTCFVYAYAQSGVYAKVKVVVK